MRNWQKENGNIANQINGFTTDYSKFILNKFTKQRCMVKDFVLPVMFTFQLAKLSIFQLTKFSIFAVQTFKVRMTLCFNTEFRAKIKWSMDSRI